MAALEGGADVIVAGRACDTAIFAAMPILRGFAPALALHAAKIAECGTLCARPGGANDSLLCTMRFDHFVVRPLNPEKQCYPDTVAAHSLYEQPDPLRLYEPEGEVDLSGCTYEQLPEGAVQVRGAQMLPPAQASVKLEGAAPRGFRTVSIAGVRDPLVIHNLPQIESSAHEAVARGMERDHGAYSLRFIRYGLDGVLGPRETPPDAPPREVGLVIEAVADTQELADNVVSLARSTALHQPFEGRKTTAGNLAFPFSPSDLQAGPVYEFSVYHLMQVEDPCALFPARWEDV